MFNLDKLNKISTPDSTWRREATYRQENKEWLYKSAKIALIVLRALKDKSISQKDLAGLMGVKPQQITKIVKGNENLTLETICKLEKALKINIIEVNTQFEAEFVNSNLHTKEYEFKHTTIITPFKNPIFNITECVKDYKNI